MNFRAAFTPDATSSYGTTAGLALSVVIVWAIESFTTVKVPGEVAAAFGTLFGIGLGILFTATKAQGESDETDTQGA